MSEGLLSCPFCGSDDLDVEFPLIECLRCGCEGPSNWTDGGERCVCDWNTRATALAWTSERPTVPAAYWLRQPGWPDDVVRLDQHDIDRWRADLMDPGIMWAGPLPEPAGPAKEGGEYPHIAKIRRVIAEAGPPGPIDECEVHENSRGLDCE